jgi:hypothetical protein
MVSQANLLKKSEIAGDRINQQLERAMRARYETLALSRLSVRQTGQSREAIENGARLCWYQALDTVGHSL